MITDKASETNPDEQIEYVLKWAARRNKEKVINYLFLDLPGV